MKRHPIGDRFDWIFTNKKNARIIVETTQGLFLPSQFGLASKLGCCVLIVIVINMECFVKKLEHFNDTNGPSYKTL